MNRRLFLIVVFQTLALLGVSISSGAGQGWQAGLAKAKITPEAGLWMAGYAARDHAAEGAMHDLWIKALALSDAEGHKAVLVSLDLLGLPRSIYDNVCGRLKEQCGLDRADVMFCASHTHSGPVLRGALYDIYPLDDEQLARIEKYSTELETRLVETVARALDEMEPVNLALGSSSASFGANRRGLRTAATGATAPVDHIVPVLSVRSAQGQPRAILFGYACHNTTLDINQWNGDYAGFAQLAIEDRFPGAQAMFVAGCGADQNPNPRRSVELCQQHGLALADAVCSALNEPMEPISPKLQTAIELIDLPYGEQPDDEYLEKTAAGDNYVARWAGRLLKERQAGRPFAESYPGYPVQMWRLGDYRLVALGGEVVVDYVLTLRERLGPNTWVAAYSNDVMAYIPSSRVRAEGGYEAGAFSVYGLPALSWSADIEDRILSAAERLSKRLGGE
jgi:hypothetical protein